MEHDAIEIPESTREAWQRTVNILADIIKVPAAVIVRVCDEARSEVFVASCSEGNVYASGEMVERHPDAYFEAAVAKPELSPELLPELLPDLLKVANAATDGGFRGGPAASRGMLSCIALPLVWPDGQPFGSICIMDSRENRYSARYERLLRQFQEIVNLHLALLFQQHDLREKTRIDALTGACTRRDFFESGGIELKRARRYGISLCLMLLDFDHFKNINDQHGHAFGDAVLKHMTRLIMGSLRSSDRYYRLGGEEFVALLPHSELEGAQLVAERTRALAEARPVEFRGEELRVTLSIGVARLEGAGESLDDLLAKADRALYLAKANGRNRVEMFERLSGMED